MRRKSSQPPIRKGMLVLLSTDATVSQIERLSHRISVHGEVAGVKIIEVEPDDLPKWHQKRMLSPEEMKGSDDDDYECDEIDNS